VDAPKQKVSIELSQIPAEHCQTVEKITFLMETNNFEIKAKKKINSSRHLVDESSFNGTGSDNEDC
jgi:hypothetical protein